jgi:hypothetical protein
MGESSQHKAKMNFIKKEIDIRKAYLDDIIKNSRMTVSERMDLKRTKFETSLSTINQMISSINSNSKIGLENINEDILYIIN